MNTRVSRLSRQALLGAGAVLLVLIPTWLFLRAGAVSPQVHFDYMQTLRRLYQADVELNAAILASQAELLHNYDPVARQQRILRETATRLAEPPGFLEPMARAAVVAKTQELTDLLAAKIDMADRFEREHAVLRNSLNYFPAAAEAFLRRPGVGRREDFGRFIRGLLIFVRDPSSEMASALRLQTGTLPREELAPEDRHVLDNLLLHAFIIINRHPRVERLTRDILRAPTAAREEELTRLYTAGYEESARIAARYRILLLAAALLLVGGVAYAYIRIDRGRRALALAHRNLGERFEAQRRAEETLRLYATVFTNSAEGMIITDAAGRILAVNPAFSAITGYEAAEAIGRTPSLLRSGRHEESFYDRMWTDLQATGQWQGEIWNRRKDGAVYPEWLSITAVRDGAGTVANHIGIFTDITERKEIEARIQYMAHHDALTGLPNRALLSDRLGMMLPLALRQERFDALLLFNIDRFKTLNDARGHAFGDALLVALGGRLAGLMREGDTLARLGGDEFAILLQDVGPTREAASRAALAMAGRIRDNLLLPFQDGEEDIRLTASVGVTLCPENADDVAQDVLRRADTALHRAKEAGGGQTSLFETHMGDLVEERFRIERELRRAIAGGELRLYLQPQVDAAGQRLGAEVLVRWQHPERGLVQPGAFIPIAEESDLIVDLGTWVLTEACRLMASEQQAGRQLRLSVNLSPRHFRIERFVEWIRDLLAETGADPDSLTLEVTEGLVIDDIDEVVARMKELTALGLHFSVDDFGTGYSSLAYLKRLPIDELKIDKSFVQDAPFDSDNAALVETILAVAQHLRLKVVAEGVETEAQAQFLNQRAQVVHQGFLFGRPEPADRWVASAAGAEPPSA